MFDYLCECFQQCAKKKEVVAEQPLRAKTSHSHALKNGLRWMPNSVVFLVQTACTTCLKHYFLLERISHSHSEFPVGVRCFMKQHRRACILVRAQGIHRNKLPGVGMNNC